MSNNSVSVIVVPSSLEHKFKQAGPQVTLDTLLGCQFKGINSKHGCVHTCGYTYGYIRKAKFCY